MDFLRSLNLNSSLKFTEQSNIASQVGNFTFLLSRENGKKSSSAKRKLLTTNFELRDRRL